MRTLRQTLQEEGLTQAEAAYALDCTRSTLYRWLDMDAMELPGKVALWCAGYVTVEWPEDFKPRLKLVEGDHQPNEFQRRLELVSRLLGRVQRAVLTAQALEESTAPAGDQKEKGSATVDSPMALPDDAAMNRLKRERRPGQQAKTTSFDWYDDDRALAARASQRLGMTVAQFIRYAVRRVGGEIDTEKAG